MTKKQYKILSIVLALFCIVMICLGFTMHSGENPLSEELTCLTATIESVSVTNTGRNTHIEFHVIEHNASVYVSTNIAEHLDLTYIQNITTGEKISFCIYKSSAHLLTQEETFVNAVSLSVGNDDLFNLDDYRSNMKTAAFPAKILNALIIILSLIAFVYLFNKSRR